MRIIQKNSTLRENYYPSRVSMKSANRLQGPRELCADSICSVCNLMQDQVQLKKCKQKCFDENELKINECCRRICPETSTECLEACSQRLF